MRWISLLSGSPAYGGEFYLSGILLVVGVVQWTFSAYEYVGLSGFQF